MNINEKLPLPENFKPDYKLLEIKDITYKPVKRFTARIILDKNLSKKEIEQNHKHITRQIYKKYKPNAISIFGYFERDLDEIADIKLEIYLIDDYKYSFTAGMSEFCPFGDWTKASISNNLKDYEFKLYI